MAQDNFLKKQAVNYLKFLRGAGLQNIHLNLGAANSVAVSNDSRTAPAVEEVSSPDKIQYDNPMPSAEEIANADWPLLAKMVAGCQKCRLCRSRTQSVLEDGSRSAKLVFVGEGPGADEDAQGVPFVGRAGQLLTKIIESGLKMSRANDVYICNIVKCRPPENRNPQADEAGICLPYLQRQLELIQPKIIIALGLVPANVLLGTYAKPQAIGSLRGKSLDYRGVKLIATYHPAYLLRSPNEKVKVWEDIKDVPRLLEENT